jgi:hypothetical protein
MARAPDRPEGRDRTQPAAPVPDDTTIATLAALSPEERQVLLKVSEILKRLQFGTVLLVVQDGKVVQIEMAEKFRLR